MGPFDLVFLDPPYGEGLGEQALASALAGGWLAPTATIVLEDRSDVTLQLPPGFVLDDRREYGAAAVHFIGLGVRGAEGRWPRAGLRTIPVEPPNVIPAQAGIQFWPRHHV